MNIGIIILLVLIFVAIGITVPLVLVNRSEKKKQNREEENKIAEQQREFSRYGLMLKQSGFEASKIMYFYKNYIAVDAINKMINITADKVSRTIAYKDLVAFEMIENGQSITSSSTGNAVAGGLLFGAAGAVVGSTMKKTSNVCSNMQLRIDVNDVLNPSIVMNLISPPGAIKNGIMYTQAFNFAKDVCSTLAVIQKQGA